MNKFRIVFLLLFFISFVLNLGATDVYTYYLDSKAAYKSNGNMYAEYKLLQVFELAMLVNDYTFCREIIHDYSVRPEKNYSEDLCLFFFRFAYSSNDADLIESIFKIIPISLRTHLETAHHLYIDTIKSAEKDASLEKNMNSVLGFLPSRFQNFYRSLLENSNYYLFFTPMTFSEGQETLPVSVAEDSSVITNTAEKSTIPFPPVHTADNDTPPADKTSELPSDKSDNTVVPKTDTVSARNGNSVDAATKKIYIQVGSFAVRENAEELARELQLRKFDASISTGEIQGQTYYRVIVLVRKGYTLDEYLGILYEHGYGGIKY